MLGTMTTEKDATPAGADRLFGEIAVRLFMTTRRDVERALKAQREAREAGGDPSLGEVMVGLDLLEADQVATVLRAQAIYDDRTIETLYGQLAVKNGFVSASDLELALTIQRRTGARLRIGEVLVKKGFITWEQHEALLRTQERVLQGLEQSGRAPRARAEAPKP
jgi:hypothetical protein